MYDLLQYNVNIFLCDVIFKKKVERIYNLIFPVCAFQNQFSDLYILIGLIFWSSMNMTKTIVLLTINCCSMYIK